jgi:hypothetical protein
MPTSKLRAFSETCFCRGGGNARHDTAEVVEIGDAEDLDVEDCSTSDYSPSEDSDSDGDCVSLTDSGAPPQIH